MDELEITTLITRLSRPHSSGGVAIERAAILAAGSDSPAIINWIIAHAGAPETTAPPRSHGLHGSRIKDGEAPAFQQPLRYVLPPQPVS